MSLYRFKSQETADLVMLQVHGERILSALGKDLTKGVIRPPEIPQCIELLRSVAAREAEEHQRLKQTALDNGDPPPNLDPVSFASRTVPFVDMLQRCEGAGVDVVWGV
ncbi:MAG: DUF1840 domain-containing protein [Hydrogenophaga sp.]